VIRCIPILCEFGLALDNVSAECAFRVISEEAGRPPRFAARCIRASKRQTSSCDDWRQVNQRATIIDAAHCTAISIVGSLRERNSANLEKDSEVISYSG